MTPCTPNLKLECLSYIMVPCHTCHHERKLRTIVFLENSLRETPCRVTILVHFYPFWCSLVHLMCDPMTPLWLALTLFPFQVSIKSRKRSYMSLRTNSKHFCSVMVTILVHLAPFWFILVHLMGNPTTPLHQIFIKSSKICILRVKSFNTQTVPPS